MDLIVKLADIIQNRGPALSAADVGHIEAAIAALRAVREAPVAIMDKREFLSLCAPTEDDFPALYALQGRRVRLVPVGEGEVSDCRRGCEFDTCEEPGAPGCGVRNDD